jgi:hypothetical protein
MNLLQLLLEQKCDRSPTSVPDWIMGCFRRRSISFYNGLTDCDTRVFWLQSQTLTIDLRLPLTPEQTVYNGPMASSPKLDYEGWYAKSVWDSQHKTLSWTGGDAHQLHNKWPEPAILDRIGNCMMEFAPSGIYVEDWRLLSNNVAPLIGLELVKEKNIDAGTENPRKGALLVCGQYAGLVVGRERPVSDEHESLKDAINTCQNEEQAQQLLSFETSVATGSIDSGFNVLHSLDVEQVGQPLFDMNSFELDHASGDIVQTIIEDNQTIKRYFKLETFIADFHFMQTTTSSDDAEKWYSHEEKTLGRYTKEVF